MNVSSATRQAEADDLLTHSDIFVLTGLGAHVSVHRGMLHIQQGATHGEEPQAYSFQRGVHHLTTLYLLSNDGSISLAALEWCQQQGISVCKLGALGEYLSVVLPPRPAYQARLRRLQYLLDDEQVLALARYVIRAKTLAQIKALGALPAQNGVDKKFAQRFLRQAPTSLPSRIDPGDSILRLQEGLIQLEDPTLTLTYLSLLEARLATSYYQAFVGRPLRWKEKDREYIPASWSCLGGRGSEISTNGRPQHATHPFNAALNYLYAVTEHLLELACQVLGLDPAVAVLHADQEGRPSLIYDLIEPLRPVLDGRVLKFFQQTELTMGDMETLQSGEVRFNPDFTRLLLASCRVSVSEVEAEVEAYIRQLLGVQ